MLFLENDLSYKTVTIKGGLSILGTVLWKICLVQVGILAEASQHQERVVHKITAAKKPPKAAVCVQYQLFIGDVGVVKAHSFPMSLTGCPELQSAEMFFFVYVSNQRPFCFEIGSQTIIALLPSLFSWGKNVLNLIWSFPRFS